MQVCCTASCDFERETEELFSVSTMQNKSPHRLWRPQKTGTVRPHKSVHFWMQLLSRSILVTSLWLDILSIIVDTCPWVISSCGFVLSDCPCDTSMACAIQRKLVKTVSNCAGMAVLRRYVVTRQDIGREELCMMSIYSALFDQSRLFRGRHNSQNRGNTMSSSILFQYWCNKIIRSDSPYSVHQFLQTQNKNSALISPYINTTETQVFLVLVMKLIDLLQMSIDRDGSKGGHSNTNLPSLSYLQDNRGISYDSAGVAVQVNVSGRNSVRLIISNKQIFTRVTISPRSVRLALLLYQIQGQQLSAFFFG